MKEILPNSRILLTLLLAALCAAFMPDQASAHRINLFAWLEGNTVMVQCGFNRSTPVKNSEIKVFDAVDGSLILSGKTNDQGEFSFKVPPQIRQGHGLRIAVSLGDGHTAQYTMNAAEFYEAAALEAGFENAEIAGRKLDAGDNAAASAQSAPVSNLGLPAPASPGLDEEKVKQLIDQTLDRHLAPIHRALGTDSRISLGAVLGGIGWLVGIVGIFCYFRSRRRS